jgi:hypothetical protein
VGVGVGVAVGTLARGLGVEEEGVPWARATLPG